MTECAIHPVASQKPSQVLLNISVECCNFQWMHLLSKTKRVMSGDLGFAKQLTTAEAVRPNFRSLHDRVVTRPCPTFVGTVLHQSRAEQQRPLSVAVVATLKIALVIAARTLLQRRHSTNGSSTNGSTDNLSRHRAQQRFRSYIAYEQHASE